MKRLVKKIIPWLNIEKKINALYGKLQNQYNKNNIQIAKYYSYKIYKKYNCHFSVGANIGKNLHIPHPTGIVIGAGVIIGNNCTIYQNVTLGRKNKDISEYPKIGNNVTIYCNTTIIGNVTIGDNAVIGCNSVVMRDVKPNETVSGIVK